MGKTMRSYDLVLVLGTSLAEAERKKILENIENWLGKAEIKSQELGRKTLAYPLKKEREGLFVLLKINYQNGTTVPVGLEKKLLMNDNILRHLLVRGKKNGRKKS